MPWRHASSRTSARLLLAGKLDFPYERNGDRDAVLRQRLEVFRNPSESSLNPGFMLERSEPRRKAANKGRLAGVLPIARSVAHSGS